jgi:hypothetical protein
MGVLIWMSNVEFHGRYQVEKHTEHANNLEEITN